MAKEHEELLKLRIREAISAGQLNKNPYQEEEMPSFKDIFFGR